MERAALRELVHATAIVVDGSAVMLLGSSGAGKSDLAFRAITQPFAVNGRIVPVGLLADDQVLLERRGAELIARSPEAIRGLLELRGLGIASLAAVDEAPLKLAVRLAPVAVADRLPEPATCTFLGLQIALVTITPESPSAAARIVAAACGLIVGIGVPPP